ncbi:unnamed protein product [Knipowitschia caucasica]|uniref:Alpha-2-macroglobulin bait region domain-containing protein n=1 Tax=Knipowitschia caucasica TaxID=637954 RepID=A0AAV2JY23_KNICA
MEETLLTHFLLTQVKVQHHNDTAAVDTEVHLLKESFDLLQTLKTDDNGLASFKLNTSLFQGSFTVKASVYKMYTHTLMRPHFALASLHLTEIQQTSLHTRTSSSLEVQAEDRPLVCGAQETLNLSYSIVGEGQGQLHIIYLLLSRGNIVKYGQYSNYMDTMTRGDISFFMEITPDLAPAVTLVAYAVLPSASVIATSKEYITTKCFSNEVFPKEQRGGEGV